MAGLLGTIAIIAIAVIVSLIKGKLQESESNALVKQSKNMSLEELVSLNDASEAEWKEWNEKWAKKTAHGKDASAEYQGRAHAAWKVNLARNTIKEKYPEVITEPNKLKEKAYSVATDEEKKEMKSLENSLQARREGLAASGVQGGQLLESTHSAVLNGVVAGQVAGPVAGAVAYGLTQEKNQQIQSDNITKRAENTVWTQRTKEMNEMQSEIYSTYKTVVLRHDSSVKIHVFEGTYV